MPTEYRLVVYLVLGAATAPLKKRQGDRMKRNGQGPTADSNEIHYMGVKEVPNNDARPANATSSLQHLLWEKGSKDMPRERIEREGKKGEERTPFLETFEWITSLLHRT